MLDRNFAEAWSGARSGSEGLRPEARALAPPERADRPRRGEGAGGAASPHGEAEGRRAGRRRRASPERKAASSGSNSRPRSPPRRLVSQGPSGPGLHLRGRPRDTHITWRLQSGWAFSGPRGRTRSPLFRLDPHSELPNATSGQDRAFRSPKLWST